MSKNVEKNSFYQINGFPICLFNLSHLFSFLSVGVTNLNLTTMKRTVLPTTDFGTGTDASNQIPLQKEKQKGLEKNKLRRLFAKFRTAKRMKQTAGPQTHKDPDEFTKAEAAENIGNQGSVSPYSATVNHIPNVSNETDTRDIANLAVSNTPSLPESNLHSEDPAGGDALEQVLEEFRGDAEDVQDQADDAIALVEEETNAFDVLGRTAWTDTNDAELEAELYADMRAEGYTVPDAPVNNSSDLDELPDSEGIFDANDVSNIYDAGVIDEEMDFDDPDIAHNIKLYPK